MLFSEILELLMSISLKVQSISSDLYLSFSEISGLVDALFSKIPSELSLVSSEISELTC